jgi:RNA polymerase sigma-70 factor (ECF subfamily)
MQAVAMMLPFPSWARRRRERTATVVAVTQPEQATLSREDARLVERLRAGDEPAFMELVDRYGRQMLAVAQLYVSNRTAAEEVVQDTWLGVLTGIDRFEGRSSLKTWIFRILTNQAKTRGVRERRQVPFSSLAQDDDRAEAAVDALQFDATGHWFNAPQSFSSQPEERLLSAEIMDVVRETIATLPTNQRTVITLRDVEGWDADEVRDLLDVSDVNQRVLLHRARTKVRKALEEHLDG